MTARRGASWAGRGVSPRRAEPRRRGALADAARRSFALPALILALLLLSPLARASAGGGGWPAARDAFLKAVASGDPDAVVVHLMKLREHDRREVAELILRHLLPHEDLLVHKESLETLAQLKNADGRKVVADAARKHKEWEVRASLARVLGVYPGEYPLAALGEMLTDRKWQVRSSAIRALAEHRQSESIDLLVGCLDREGKRIQADIVWSLRRLTGERLRPEGWGPWWQTQRQTFEMPTLAEVRVKEKEEGSKDLHTAVREGLYGPIYSERVAFCFDISGSMTAGTELQGNRFEIARRELIRVLENQITPSTHFNIIAFAEAVVPFKGRLQKAKTKNIKRAMAFLKKLTPGGETNAYGSLKAAFDDPDVDTIFFLSDGTPTVGEESIPDIILLKVGEWNRNRKVVINCIGFFPGDARNQDKAEARTFLRNLAHENEGSYKEIY